MIQKAGFNCKRHQVFKNEIFSLERKMGSMEEYYTTYFGKKSLHKIGRPAGSTEEQNTKVQNKVSKFNFQE